MSFYFHKLAYTESEALAPNNLELFGIADFSRVKIDG